MQCKHFQHKHLIMNIFAQNLADLQYIYIYVRMIYVCMYICMNSLGTAVKNSFQY